MKTLRDEEQDLVVHGVIIFAVIGLCASILTIGVSLYWIVSRLW